MRVELTKDVPDGVRVALRGAAEGGPAPAGVDVAALASLGFEGKTDQVASVPDNAGGLVVVVGLGRSVDAGAMRRAAAVGARVVSRHSAVAVHLLDVAPPDEQPALAEPMAEGLVLGTYQYRRFKSAAAPATTAVMHVVAGGGKRRSEALDLGVALAEAVNLARDLVNEPGGSLTPQVFAEVAADVAQREDLQISILDEADIVEARLGGLLGVNRGSVQPPRFVELTYEPASPRGTLALVGKGITFDSGGLSIKSGEGMMAMKNDMAGAAAVLGAMSVLARAKVRCRVRAYLPLTDNMTGGDATRPGDVLQLRNGRTVEVLNTDAEGRLVLGDALALASEAAPDAIIDVATLTGAVEVALGNRIAGLMSNSDAWVAQIEQAGAVTGERLWRLPLPDDYRPWLDSDVADLRNISKVPKGGSITAGLFLREFVGEGIPWAHLDIAGTSWSTETRGADVVGGTGYGVRLLVELARAFSRPR